MRRLWIYLTIAFALVTLISVATAALFANRQTITEFRGFLAQSQLQESDLPATLSTYYQEHGSWTGVEQVFAQRHGPGGQGTGRGFMRGSPSFVLTDSAGRLVYDSNDGTPLPSETQSDILAVPILVDGATVGFLTAHSTGQMGLTAAAERFLAQVNRALIQAALIGAALGAIVGLFLARGLAAPLDRLASASRQLALGDLSQRVPLDGPLELVAASQAFNEMAGALEEAEELRRRMISDIAHELRTPLAVIQGNLQAILDDVYPLEKPEVQTIFDETLLLSRLVDDLRELALAEAGQLRLQPQAVDTATLLTQSIAVFSGPAAEKGIQLKSSIPDKLPLVWSDAARSSQVLRNLMANALRYTPQDGVLTLRARADTTHPDSTDSNAPGGYIRFEVEDNGPGIAPEEVEHVFERFWRAERSRSRAHGGSGLGLAIAQQLVHAQGGQIGVSSVVGRGSCFWFTLPVVLQHQLQDQAIPLVSEQLG